MKQITKNSCHRKHLRIALGIKLEVCMEPKMVLCLWLRFITEINIIRISNKVTQLSDMEGVASNKPMCRLPCVSSLP